MSLFLSIESAVSGFSVAVHRNASLLSYVQLCNERVASSLLTSAIEQALVFSEVEMADLDGVAVSSGPGSYTGLRVGVSTAKGLCLALDIPLISVNTLELMTYGINVQHSAEPALLCPMIDARRMEVYCGMYDFGTKRTVKAVSAEVVDQETFADVLKENSVLFFGNGAAKIQHLYVDQPNATFLTKELLPSAANMGNIVRRKFDSNEFADLTSFEPDYLKPYFATKPKNQLSPQ